MAASLRETRVAGTGEESSLPRRGSPSHSGPEVRHQLLVGGFKTGAFILVCLHAVFKPFDGLILDGKSPGVIDGALRHSRGFGPGRPGGGL